MSSPYSDIVLEHFRHPHNVGKIDNADGKAIEGSPACGDMVSVYISVDENDKRINRCSIWSSKRVHTKEIEL